MAFSEFTCRSGGNNLYAGSLDGSAEASTTPLSTWTNGNWNSATRVFTPSSNPITAGVAVGQFVSVYNDGASAPTVYISRVTAVSSTTFTLSATNFIGTAPTTSATGRTAVVGGAWAGPNGASGWPMTTVANVLTNTTGNFLRVNYKNDQTYSITAGIAVTSLSSVTHQGYTSTFGDGGKATIDGGNPGSSFVLLTLTACQGIEFADLIFQNNGSAGTSVGVSVSAGNAYFRRCVATAIRGSGFSFAAALTAIECEAYACNASNTASNAGFVVGLNQVVTFVRCVSHDNTGSNTIGFLASSSTAVGTIVFDSCIADTNGLYGLSIASSSSGNNFIIRNCDFYNNVNDGVRVTSTGGTTIFHVENCNFVKNGTGGTGYGFNDATTTTRQIVHGYNCGFGSGTAANTTGQTSLSALVGDPFSGSVTYASNTLPWVDAPNGDFRINLSTAQSAGRGAFTQTAASYTGTQAYPDIGAGQALISAIVSVSSALWHTLTGW